MNDWRLPALIAFGKQLRDRERAIAEAPQRRAELARLTEGYIFGFAVGLCWGWARGYFWGRRIG